MFASIYIPNKEMNIQSVKGGEDMFNRRGKIWSPARVSARADSKQLLQYYAKRLRLILTDSRNHDLFSRWEPERGDPPSLKRGMPPATSMTYSFLVESTAQRALWAGKKGLKGHLLNRALPRGKGIKAIRVVKVSIGPTIFYRPIEGGEWGHLNLSSPKRGLGHFVGEKVPKRYILMQKWNLSSNLPEVNLSPNHPYVAIRNPVVLPIPKGVLLSVLNLLLPPLFIGFFIWLTALPEHGTTINPPFVPALDFDDLRRTLHASIQDGISSTDVGGNVVEAPGGAHSELAVASQSTRAAKAKAIAVLVGSSVLSVIVTLNAIALKI